MEQEHDICHFQRGKHIRRRWQPLQLVGSMVDRGVGLLSTDVNTDEHRDAAAVHEVTRYVDDRQEQNQNDDYDDDN